LPTAAEILKAKLDALTDVPDGWARSIDAYQPRLLTRLNRLLADLELVDGRIAMTEANLYLIDDIVLGLRKYLTQGEYLEIVTEFSNEFLVQQGRTVSYFGALVSGEVPVTSFASAMYQRNRALAVESVLGNVALDSMLLNDVRNTLIEAVASNSRYTLTLEAMQNLVIGDPQKEGQLLRYSRQIVSDTFATTDRAFTKIVGDELGLQFYRYLGGKMKTTRCFCDVRNGGFFHRKEIEGWGNGVGIGKCDTGKGWAGMMPNTNEDTIFVNAGGYNCQHSILPISTFAVPKEVGLSAFEKGYFEPTRTEKEYFGI
jgi:hypothetical protein